MAESNALGGYGTLLQRGGLLVGDPYVSVGEVQKLSGGGVEVSEEESTHMQSNDGHYESIPIIAKTEPVTAELHFVPDDTMQDTLQDDAELGPAQPKRFWKITWPPSTSPSGTLTVYGFVKKFGISDVPVNGKMKASLELAISGKRVRT